MSSQAALMKLRELLVQAEHGGMSDELLDDIEQTAARLFTDDATRTITALARDAREWRRLARQRLMMIQIKG